MNCFASIKCTLLRYTKPIENDCILNTFHFQTFSKISLNVFLLLYIVQDEALKKVEDKSRRKRNVGSNNKKVHVELSNYISPQADSHNRRIV